MEENTIEGLDGIEYIIDEENLDPNGEPLVIIPIEED